jgi:hypothetical protein
MHSTVQYMRVPPPYGVSMGCGGLQHKAAALGGVPY